jgi:hypothetical protein
MHIFQKEGLTGLSYPSPTLDLESMDAMVARGEIFSGLHEVVESTRGWLIWRLRRRLGMVSRQASSYISLDSAEENELASSEKPTSWIDLGSQNGLHGRKALLK